MPPPQPSPNTTVESSMNMYGFYVVFGEGARRAGGAEAFSKRPMSLYGI